MQYKMLPGLSAVCDVDDPAQILKRQQETWLSCSASANLRKMDSEDSGTKHELNYGFRIPLTQFVSFFGLVRLNQQIYLVV